MGGYPQHVCSRVGGRSRHWAVQRHGVAVRARREVRAMPDLRQRAVALRTARRSDQSRLPSHVRRPYARSKDAAVTPVAGGENRGRDVRRTASTHLPSKVARLRFSWRMGKLEARMRLPRRDDYDIDTVALVVASDRKGLPGARQRGTRM